MTFSRLVAFPCFLPSLKRMISDLVNVYEQVLETRDDGWWVGRCRGKTGLFPVNYVVSIP